MCPCSIGHFLKPSISKGWILRILLPSCQTKQSFWRFRLKNSNIHQRCRSDLLEVFTYPTMKFRIFFNCNLTPKKTQIEGFSILVPLAALLYEIFQQQESRTVKEKSGHPKTQIAIISPWWVHYWTTIENSWKNTPKKSILFSTNWLIFARRWFYSETFFPTKKT